MRPVLGEDLSVALDPDRTLAPGPVRRDPVLLARVGVVPVELDPPLWLPLVRRHQPDQSVVLPAPVRLVGVARQQEVERFYGLGVALALVQHRERLQPFWLRYLRPGHGRQVEPLWVHGGLA